MQERPAATNNFWLKLFSVVLASLIWFVVDSDLKNSRVTEAPNFTDANEFSVTNVPVAVLTSPGDLRAFAADPPRVDVTLKAIPGSTATYGVGEVRVYVDLSRDKEPALLEPIHITTPPELTPLRANPPMVKLTEIRR